MPTICAAVVAMAGLCVAVDGPANAQSRTAQPAPGAGPGEKYLVVAANPYASRAGAKILAAGGSAIDAAITVQLILTLVEPQSSGIGGGAFILHWDKAARKIDTYDGRETAPRAARPDRFYRNGKLLSLRRARFSGLSVGVPGVIRLLEHVHRKHGRLPWASLFAPAIKLADNGFRVSPRLSGLLRRAGRGSFSRTAQKYFFNADGTPVATGSRLRNRRYGATLRAIARHGSRAFYQGYVAERIVRAVRSARGAAGDMTLADLQAYRVQERPPVCIRYRGFRVCGMGPPSSGATTVAQTLKLIEPFKPVRATSRGLPAPFMHLVAEAQRLAFADRARYIADPAFQHVPVNDLLNDSYLDRRRRLIAPDRAMRRPPPPGAFGKGWRQRNGKDRTVEGKGTSHMSILDRYGNGVSMTTTIEGAFGSRLMAAGFLLNNELTDFSLPYQDRRGHKIANRVEGGKRPRSSMAPTMIFDRNGRLVALLGSPGGEKIILYVTKLIVALIDYGMSPERAAQLANFGSTRTGGFRIEPHGAAPPVVRELQRRGHRLNIRRMISGSHLITHFGGRLRAGVDPRREGAAAGQGFRR